MEKVDIAQQREKSSHSAAAWKKGDIVEHHGKGRHSAAAFKKQS